jgi:hypothetical protein
MNAYLFNCFWMLVPVLVFNLISTSRLPAAFQTNIFWNRIPWAISVPENLLRTAVMVLPLLMRFRISTPVQRFGLALYLAGLVVYFASWTALMLFPRSQWSTSVVGFMAPAYTPILWLAGIALVGDQFQLPRESLQPWMYGSLAAVFLVFHNLHTGLVYSRSH